jgi:uncharacterized HAD superfamily protein
MTSGLAYIFDVDGTLTAEPYFNDDVRGLAPNYPILEIALSLASWDNKRVAVVTARPHYLLGATQEWLYQNGLHPQLLLTRKPGDIRPDHEVRTEQVQEVMCHLGERVVLLDDKLSNCIYVRKELGVPYIHVKSYDSLF